MVADLSLHRGQSLAENKLLYLNIQISTKGISRFTKDEELSNSLHNQIYTNAKNTSTRGTTFLNSMRIFIKFKIKKYIIAKTELINRHLSQLDDNIHQVQNSFLIKMPTIAVKQFCKRNFVLYCLIKSLLSRTQLAVHSNFSFPS